MEKSSNRQYKRYRLNREKPSFLEKKLDAELYIQLGDRLVPAAIDDISASGLGFTVEDIDETYIQVLEENDDFFMEMQLDNNRVVSYVRKIWTLRKKRDKGIIIRGGASFDILSAEDRQIIQQFVEKLHMMHGNL